MECSFLSKQESLVLIERAKPRTGEYFATGHRGEFDAHFNLRGNNRVGVGPQVLKREDGNTEPPVIPAMSPVNPRVSQ